MMNQSIDAIVKCTSAELFAEDKLSVLPKVINAVTIDSRKVNDASLFVAFKGDNVDGHDYISVAKKRGAVAALVERINPVCQLPQIKVASCQQAMADIATICRDSFSGKVVAITGSCGKTSTKEMLACILSVSHTVSVTQGNQNNELGVPLTLFNLNDNADYLVLEMGAAQVGDIAYLMTMAKPDVSLITNVRAAHIGRFGNEDNIAAGKSEIYKSLAASKVAVVNKDEKYAQQWLKGLSGHTVLSYAIDNLDASVTVTDVDIQLNKVAFTLCFEDKKQFIEMTADGRHSVSNAVSAAACALALGVKFSDIALGLQQYSGVQSRLQLLEGMWEGNLIDDSYNANPGSVKAAIDVLKKYPQKTFLVLADMAELGDVSLSEHKKMGEYAQRSGINFLFSYGTDSRYASDVFADKGLHFTDKECLKAHLLSVVCRGDSVLIKGSRSSAMDTLVTSLIVGSKK